jgi:hypothetical protein
MISTMIIIFMLSRVWIEHHIKKTLVLYVFHTYNDRVEHFIKNAVFKADDVDFVFMCNDPSFDLSSRVPILCKDV